MADITPVDYFNFYGDFSLIFKGIRDCNLITPDEVGMFVPGEPNPNDLNKATFKNTTAGVCVLKANAYGFAVNATISKFMLLSAVQFKNDNFAAQSYVMFEVMGMEIPYIRVGVDYFKVISKENRYGGKQIKLKPWKKDEIKQDHSKSLIASIPKYDDFILLPSNTDHQAYKNNCFNLYSKFSHEPYKSDVSTADIPVSLMFLKHIFVGASKDQFDLGLKYMKVLYDHPRQCLPILTLVSKERDTGKTTFINWLEMIFGDNYTLISPDDLVKNFNSAYASKNIIVVEETFIEKQAGIEKLKYLSTGKRINLSQKFVSEYDLPLFSKVVLCTNKVKDFMKIDSEEIRFWIRPIPVIIGKKNTQIEEQLFNEIPKFLKFLQQLPSIDLDTGSRMVFTKDEIQTDELQNVKEESRSQLFKEIEIFVQNFFNNNPQVKQFNAALTDIKDEWFKNNNQVSMSYIRKVLQDEAGMIPERSVKGKCIKYYRFADETNPHAYKTGYPYLFIRQDEVDPEEMMPF